MTTMTMPEAPTADYAAQDDNLPVQLRRDALEQSVILLSPTVGWWKGQYQLPRNSTETTTGGHVVDSDDVTTPRAKLMQDAYPLDRAGVPWKKRFQAIDNRLNRLKSEFSVPFPVTGVRIVPKAAGRAMLERLYGLTFGQLKRQLQAATDENRYSIETMRLQRQYDEAVRLEGENPPDSTPLYDSSKGDFEQSIAYDLHVAAKEFCADWPRIREQLAEKNDVFRYVESRIPHSGSVMRGKFYLEVVPIELAGNSGGTVIDNAALEAHHDVVQEACRRKVEEAIESMVSGPRQQLAAALAGLQDVIARDGKVSTKSFAPVHAAIAKIRLFDFVANDELLAQINAMERRLETTAAKTLDSTTAATSGFSSAIDALMTEVQNETKAAADIDAYGRAPRGISFRNRK